MSPSRGILVDIHVEKTLDYDTLAWRWWFVWDGLMYQGHGIWRWSALRGAKQELKYRVEESERGPKPNEKRTYQVEV